MKASNMRTPNLEEIFNQKSQYQQHKRKLHKIYQQRKSQLGYDSTRMTQFDHIKESKTKTFIHKFNRKNDAIAKQNLKLLGKLQNVKPSLSRRSVSASQDKERSQYSFVTPFVKKRMLQTEKQNLRISQRMRNMSSSLNQKSFMRDYSKSQQIKNRLMRYTAEESKVYLKSERYLNDGENSICSYSKQQNSIKNNVGKNSKTAQGRRSIASHYKKEDILKNRIDARGNLASIKKKNKDRPNTSFDNINSPQENSFFTTEPKKQHRVQIRKKRNALQKVN